MNKKERIIKEIEKEPVYERFPIKKKLDLKQELANAYENLDFVGELSILIGKLENTEKIDLNKLKLILTKSATCRIIIEKIRSKI
jgi:hypothetical protein